MSESFGAYARYYDLLYRDKDYAAEARYVHGLIQRHAPGARTMLELGCGTGAHAVEFAGFGYEVHGVDASHGMLEQAQTRRTLQAPELARRLTFSTGDARSFRAGHQFDAVTALFHVVSYQVTDDDLAQTFATAAAHLAPGGIFLFDCWYGPAVLADPPVVRVKKLEDADTRVQREAIPTMLPGQNVTEVNYRVLVTDLASGRTEEFHELHRMRYLFEKDIERAIEGAGLICEAREEWGSRAPLSSKTWSALVIARRLGQ